jgi:hypothetical protein
MPQFAEYYQEKPFLEADSLFTTLLDADQLLSLRSVQRFARLGTTEIFDYPGRAEGLAHANEFRAGTAAYEVLHSKAHALTGINKVYLDTGEVEGVIVDESQKPVNGLEVGGAAQAVWKATSGIFCYEPMRLDGTVPGQVNSNVSPNDMVTMARSKTTRPIFIAGAEAIARQYAGQRTGALLTEVEQRMPDTRLYKLGRLLRRAGRAVVFMGMSQA